MTKQQGKDIQILELQSALEAEKFAHQLTENSLKEKDGQLKYCHERMGEAYNEIRFQQQQLKEKEDRIKELEDGLNGFLKDGHGCRFCDSGKLRTENNPDKDHDYDCPYYKAKQLLTNQS